MIELDDQSNLYHALHSMNHAQVDAAFINSSHTLGFGVLTRERINNYQLKH